MGSALESRVRPYFPALRAPVVAAATKVGSDPTFPRRRLVVRLPPDARLYQIAFQAILLTVGVLVRDFALDPRQMALAFAAGLVTQRLWLRALELEHKGSLSALIT